MYHKVQGTGLYGRIPTPNGGSIVEVALGDMHITSGILRGGATLDENTSKGGTFGSVSIGRHTHLSTTPAMNEGNIRDVLTSPHADAETKQMVAKYLITRVETAPPASAVTSINSGAATGSTENVPELEPTKTGVDNIVDKTAETVQEVVPPTVESVSKATVQVSEHVSTAASDTINSVSTASTQWTR